MEAMEELCCMLNRRLFMLVPVPRKGSVQRFSYVHWYGKATCQYSRQLYCWGRGVQLGELSCRSQCPVLAGSNPVMHSNWGGCSLAGKRCS